MNSDHKHLNSRAITIAARGSKLSQIQVWEVHKEITQFFPHIEFYPLWVTTTGDKDLSTSLKTLGNTDFFTKEIDTMLLNGEARIAIHSAKDLPSPLPEGLNVVAITKGLDSSDSLVLRDGMTLEKLQKGANIATSSIRREETIKMLIPDAQVVDIRGTIERRLEQLDMGNVDGLVVAECALIRLGLTSRNRLTLPGTTAEGQGQLAVVARNDDKEMQKLFAHIHISL